MISETKTLIQHVVAALDTRGHELLLEMRNSKATLTLNSAGQWTAVPETNIQWNDDEILKTIMSDLRKQFEVLSHCCVKFTLLLANTTTGSKIPDAAVESMSDELGKTVQVLVNVFLYVDC
jgi:hypothetical protein